MNLEQVINILQWCIGFLGSAAGVWFLTQIVKKANSIPFIREGQTPRVRAVAMAFSALAVVILNIVSHGTVDVDSLKDLVIKLLEVGVVWGGAHTVHEVANKL